MTNQTLDKGLDSSENRALETKGKRLFQKAKQLLIIPLIAATITVSGAACKGSFHPLQGKGMERACNPFFYEGGYVEEYIDRDGTDAEIVKKSATRKEHFYLKGPAIDSLNNLSAENMQLVEYINTPVGFFTQETYKDRTHIVEKEIIANKEKEARRILIKSTPYMVKYMRK